MPAARSEPKLGKRDLDTIRWALKLAIEYEDSALDSVTCGWRELHGKQVAYVPKEYRKSANRSKRAIATFQRVLAKLEE